MSMNFVKCVCVGDGATGKTSLLLMYTSGEFPRKYVPTIFENYTLQQMCGDKAVSLSLYDTAGQEDYDSMRTMSYPGTDVFLICFSVISRESFANVKMKWVKELNKLCAGVPYVLVGLKTDLRTDDTILQTLSNNGSSPVTRQEGEALAAEIKAYKYVECSALAGEGINDVFQQAMLVGMLHSSSAAK